MDNSLNRPPGSGCPGSASRQWDPAEVSNDSNETEQTPSPSALGQWPIQLTLLPPNAPYFNDAELILTADCIPFAYNNFHQEFLKGKAIAIACPKLDDLQSYVDKLTQIFKSNKLKSVEVLLMEVPCCGGLAQAAQIARQQAGADFPLTVTTIGVKGEHFGTKSIS